MSLRLRLSLIVSALFLMGVVTIFFRTIIHAKVTVENEVDSASNLTLELLALTDWDMQSVSANDELSSIASRYEEIGNTMHIRFFIDNGEKNLQDIYEQELMDLKVPDWFYNAINPKPQQIVRSLLLSDGNALILYCTPVDSIMEAWDVVVENLIARFVALSLFVLIMFYFLDRWLKPASQILSVIDGVEKGDFSRKVPEMPLPEFNIIGDRVNRLSSVLGASKAENNRLVLKAQNIQEKERRYLAQELHDALGQSVSAVKAIAVSLQHKSLQKGQNELADNAQRIEKIADEAYESVRTLMRSLRPFEIDELGLVPALQQMVDEWNDNHEETFCRLQIEGKFDDLQDIQKISIFRIIQEGLTNVAKYAKATVVDVILSGQEVVTLIIADDGVGFDEEKMLSGMGFQGLRDRVQVLQGVLTLNARPLQGVNIQIEFPRQIISGGRKSGRHKT